MSPELIQKLKDKNPGISFNNISGGDGWFVIMEQMCFVISCFLQNVKHTGPNFVFRIDQTKEKFGSLRVYFTSENGDRETDRFLDGVVRLAEALSDVTCEKCGSTKNVGHTRGWIKTVCQGCIPKGQEWEPLDAP